VTFGKDVALGRILDGVVRFVCPFLEVGDELVVIARHRDRGAAAAERSRDAVGFAENRAEQLVLPAQDGHEGHARHVVLDAHEIEQRAAHRQRGGHDIGNLSPSGVKPGT
jgi:hypothetical protein